MEKRETNPNGANQYLLDPRQKICWDYYINPKSETFGNALQSARKAGYTEGTSNQITTFDWFIEKLRRLNMLGKAEKVLDKTLSYETDNGGKEVQVDLLRVQVDAAKHITKTLGKNEGYNEEKSDGDTNIIQINVDKMLNKIYGESGEVHTDS